MPKLNDVKVVKDKHKLRLMAIPGVVLVSLGRKVVGGRTTEEAAIVVHVRRKRPKAMVSKKELVPKMLVGANSVVYTDVVEEPDIVAEIYRGGKKVKLTSVDRTGRFDPVEAGISCSHPKVTAGTIGVNVQEPSSDWVLISNNHVIANSNDAEIGDHVLQPGVYDGGVNSDAVAVLEKFVEIKFQGNNGNGGSCPLAKGFAGLGNVLGAIVGSRYRVGVKRIAFKQSDMNKVDIALARYMYNVRGVSGSVLELDNAWHGILESGDLSLGQGVVKSGRTTAVLSGAITGLDAMVNVGYGAGKIALYDWQILTSNMSAGGDSGSAVFTQDQELLIGFLFAGGDTVTVVNPIEFVISELGLPPDYFVRP